MPAPSRIRNSPGVAASPASRRPPAPDSSVYRQLLAPQQPATGETLAGLTRQVCQQIMTALESAVRGAEAVSESAPKSPDGAGGLISTSHKMRRIMEIAARLDRCAVIAQSCEWIAVDCNMTLARVSEELRDVLTDTSSRIVWQDLPRIRSMAEVLPFIFHELILNAVNYRSAEPLEVAVKARRHGSGWSFSVDDNGIGIDRKHWASVFEPFFTVDPRAWRPGLGLTMARMAVEHLGGQIHVETSRRGGAAFTFSLPGSFVFPN